MLSPEEVKALAPYKLRAIWNKRCLRAHISYMHYIPFHGITKKKNPQAVARDIFSCISLGSLGYETAFLLHVFQEVGQEEQLSFHH